MNGGWIGVDLDGTLAEYHGWNGGVIGPPIPRMLARVRRWLAEGLDVRIVTARVSPVGHTADEVRDQRYRIAAWCARHLGRELDVTYSKDYGMIELWDDRAVQVVPNTGERADGRPD